MEILPLTPFLLLAYFCCQHISAASIFLLPASAMLILAMLAMSNIYGRVLIVFLIIFKYIYFFTRIETVKA